MYISYILTGIHYNYTLYRYIYPIYCDIHYNYTLYRYIYPICSGIHYKEDLRCISKHIYTRFTHYIHIFT